MNIIFIVKSICYANKEFKYHLSSSSISISLSNFSGNQRYISKSNWLWVMDYYGYPYSIVVLFLKIINIKYISILINSNSHFHSHLHCRFTFLAVMETEYNFGPKYPNCRIIISSCNAVVRLWLNTIVTSERTS